MGGEHLQSIEAQYIGRMIESLEKSQATMMQMISDYRESLSGLMVRIDKRITLLEVRSSILWGLLGAGTGSGGTWLIIKTLSEKFAAGG